MFFLKSRSGRLGTVPCNRAFVNKRKDLGYEQAELIPTDNGRFMSPWEAKWMALSGSVILFGKK